MGTRYLNTALLNFVLRPSVKSVRNLYRDLFVSDISKVPEKYLKHVYYHQVMPGRMLSWFTLAENLLTIRQWEPDLYIGDRLDQLQVPVRFIWGKEDAFEKPETGFPKASVIRDVKLHAVDNAGHCPWFNQPEECIRLIHDSVNDSK